MASIIMHIAVSEQIYRRIKNKINIDYYEYILGTIAPDISKTIGEEKNTSHFYDGQNEYPNTSLFLEKYKNSLSKSFNLGYFLHLYTDKLFYRDFLPLFIQEKFISANVKCLDGTIINMSNDDYKELLYNDYSNLNQQLLDEYNLSLDLFYNDFKYPKTDITEIPVEKLEILIENVDIMIQNLCAKKAYIIELSSIKAFIDDCVEEIYAELLRLI